MPFHLLASMQTALSGEVLLVGGYAVKRVPLGDARDRRPGGRGYAAATEVELLRAFSSLYAGDH